MPVEKDRLFGGRALETQARVSAQTGDANRAIPLIGKLLTVRYGEGIFTLPLTPAILRLDPMFDPLRNDPRFQKLVESKP